MTRVAVTGYASMDYAVRLDGPPLADRTVRIVQRSSDGWPRLGGSPSYVARALAGAGVKDAVPISWVGGDADGDHYIALLATAGLSTTGIDRAPGRTPISILAYQPDGGCACLFDKGLDDEPVLSPRQSELVASAGWVCLTVGPPAVSRAVLDVIGPEVRLVWAVKGDPKALTPELATAIAGRADVITYSQRERSFLEPILAAAGKRIGRILVETRGAEGAVVTSGKMNAEIACEPVTSSDTTGAGDTFVGGLIASLMRDSADPRRAVQAAMTSVTRLLVSR